MNLNFQGKEYTQIPGYKDYFVSEDGLVLSTRHKKPKLLSTFLSHGTYKEVKLGRTKHMKIHSAVLRTYCGEKPAGMEARHLDGNAQNNHRSNLVWGTRRENNADQLRHGTAYVAQGEQHGKAKLSQLDVVTIRDSSERPFDLARKYGVTYRQIHRVQTRAAWAHL